ncbi:MAG: nitroreductase family protein [Candidatus Eisenbacteria bacterium]|uniref:Nitroreductase family protein n=1 Tax=Eiseniibacteriota bacterium TaxID=2212470 RepID=A0A7Y2EHE7_UNCEI|nr:nitroreductase family protein [Candidatus Eisenbacteria bacterium]
MTKPYPFKPLEFERLSREEQKARLGQFVETLSQRRTVREFSPDPIDLSLVEDAIRIAGLAPSGANQQPWHFSVVVDQEVKRKIRKAAEEEEYQSYHGRMPQEWLDKLAPLGTDEHKPFLEIAPALIIVFKIDYGLIQDEKGNEKKEKHYYVNESVGLASGFLVAALQMAGFATLTHTPSPMGFLADILGKPKNYKAFLLIPVGFPADDARVPVITKKPFSEISDRI